MKIKHTFIALFTLVFAFIFWGCPGDLNDLNSVSVADNIAGTWHAVRDGEDYEVTITKSAESDTIINLGNFFNNGETAVAYVNNSTLELTLPPQNLGSFSIEGTGQVASDFQSISWNVVVDGDNVAITMTPGTIAKKRLISR